MVVVAVVVVVLSFAVVDRCLFAVGSGNGSGSGAGAGGRFRAGTGYGRVSRTLAIRSLHSLRIAISHHALLPASRLAWMLRTLDGKRP